MYVGIYYERRKKLLHVWDDDNGYTKKKAANHAYKLDSGGTHVSLFGDNVSRVTKWTDTDLRDNLIYESDVKPEIRYLVDTYGDDDDPSKDHRILFFDIEVAKEAKDGGKAKYSSPKDATNTITSLQVWNDVSRKFEIFLLDVGSRLESQIMDSCTLHVFDNEMEMLTAFVDYWERLKPTIITGWNIDYFDVPYIVNRLNNLFGGEMVNRLSQIGIVEENRDGDKFTIAGVWSADYMALYKKFSMGESARYSLDFISKAELNKGKVEYDGELDYLYETDIDEFIRYGLVDVELVIELDEKLGFIDLALSICHATHVPYDSVHFNSIVLDGAAFTYCRKNNIILPNKKYGKNNGKARGAFVKPPQSGLHSWGYDLDLKSLYPSIIRSFNISPETKVGKVNFWEEEVYNRQKETDMWEIGGMTSETLKINSIDLRELLESSKFTIASNGVIYRTDKKGLLPTLLETWDDERTVSKDLMKEFKRAGDMEKSDYYNTRQKRTKIQSNSLYGVLLLMNSRFYDFDNGEAITTTGSSIIKFTSKYTNYYYSKITKKDIDYCVYTDTDSVFYSALPVIEAENPGYDINADTFENASSKVIDVANRVQVAINNAYNIYAMKFHNAPDHQFIIKQENVARRGFWVKKKRYAQHMINEEGVPVDKIDIKGLDVVRSSFPQAFRDTMKAILDAILKDKTSVEVNKILIDFKSQINNSDFEDIVIPTSVKNLTKYDPETRSVFKFEKGTPAHVKAALAYNDYLTLNGLLGTRKIENGDKIVWVYLGPNKYYLESIALTMEGDPVEVVDFVREHMDRTKIFDNQMVKKIQDFYKHLNWGELTLNSNVNDFFSY